MQARCGRLLCAGPRHSHTALALTLTLTRDPHKQAGSHLVHELRYGRVRAAVEDRPQGLLRRALQARRRQILRQLRHYERIARITCTHVANLAASGEVQRVSSVAIAS